MHKATAAAVAVIVALVAIVVVGGGWDLISRQLDGSLDDVRQVMVDPPVDRDLPDPTKGAITFHNQLALPVGVWVDEQKVDVVPAFTERQVGIGEGRHAVRWEADPPMADGIALGRVPAGEEPQAINAMTVATDARIKGAAAFTPVVTNELDTPCSVAIGSAADPGAGLVTTVPGDRYRSLGYFLLDATSFVLVDCPQGDLSFGAAASDPSASPLEVDPASGVLTVTLSTAALAGR